jgi:hypothetical protein
MRMTPRPIHFHRHQNAQRATLRLLADGGTADADSHFGHAGTSKFTYSKLKLLLTILVVVRPWLPS